MKTFFNTWGLIIFSALLDSYAAFIVKTKFNELGPFEFNSVSSFFNVVMQFLKSPLMLSGIVAFACAPALWFLALNKVDLSIGYPVLVGFHLIFILFFGVALLNEAMTLNKAIGCGLILLSFFFFYKK